MKVAFWERPFRLHTYLVIIGLFFLICSINLHAQSGIEVANKAASVPVANSDVEGKLIAGPPTTTTTKPDPTKNRFAASTMATMWMALLFVIILILVVAWLIRKAYPGSNRLFGTLPILQVLGRAHLGPRQTLAMVRLDNKLILLGITDHQINPVLTIDNPDEVSRLITLIEQARPTSIGAGFKGLFSREANEIQSQQDNFDENSLKTLNNFAENDVLQLKNELNSLINKVQKYKGIGGQNTSG